MVVDARWVLRRRGGAGERHVDVLEIRGGIGVVRIGLVRAYAVAVCSAGFLGQHPATSRFIREGT